MWHDERMVTFAGIALRLIEDALRWLVLVFRSAEAVRAETLFLRRQLALFIERGVRPRRVDAATRDGRLVAPGCAEDYGPEENRNGARPQFLSISRPRFCGARAGDEPMLLEAAAAWIYPRSVCITS